LLVVNVFVVKVSTSHNAVHISRLALCDFHAVPVFRCDFFRIGEVDEQTESNFLKCEYTV